MRYYLIAGEASGDLHASRLMHALRQHDAQAEFRCYGGDLMAAQGATLVRHYREMAYMGFGPVLRHLPTILGNMRQARRDIARWRPDALILVDYPGFNLSMAKYVHKKAICPVYYYIAPKIWAWKEYRIKSIRRDVDELFSILPFEVDFFGQKHHYPVRYVGNPTQEEVDSFARHWHSHRDDFYSSNALPRERPLLALLCGSRRQEIASNLPAMLAVADRHADSHTVVVAGAPAIPPSFYAPLMQGHRASIVFGQTYGLLSEAHAALVTSGTATLETALFGVPQVVCYATPLPRLVGWLRKRVLSVEHVSLVNLIAGRQVVAELVADGFTQQNIDRELGRLLPPDSPFRQAMLQGYRLVASRLGSGSAPQQAASQMVALLGGGPQPR